MESVLMLSRIQFGATAAFHILFPMMSIGLALYLFIMEVMWLRTGNVSYYHQLRFWLKIFVLTFALGVASGFPMAFQFGMNWAAFSAFAGSFFGNILGFETTIAFTLETASLGILLFGWKYVSRTVHLIANFLVFFAASLSGFWIIAANSWMQTPMGVHAENGKVVIDNYFQAIFNPATVVTYTHTLFAAIISTLFLIAGIAAWALLKKEKTVEKTTFFLNSFKYAIAIMLIAAPLQVIVGDLIGVMVSKYQPEKFAAMELHYNTNKAGEGAPWSIVAIPNAENTGTAFEISVPNALSLITTKSLTGEVKGLNDYAPENKPSRMESILTYYSARIMILIGFLMVAVSLWALWYWRRGKLSVESIDMHPAFLRFWVLSIPLGLLAMEMGWMAREIGRQPWMIYGMLRTSNSLSSGLVDYILVTVIGAIVAIYVALLVLFIYFVRRIVEKGPDFNQTI
ncbi:MAG: cytochrome ubiquinol oxidase subunit I [Candidatus Pacebacteria bacterium]|jgi:cytochrome d ubiquinol oxidase subunit I|nr:cytochrome ubiquinol oxidase subunit I [Candidatus Paceibacterota bacterium]